MERIVYKSRWNEGTGTPVDMSHTMLVSDIEKHSESRSGSNC